MSIPFQFLNVIVQDIVFGLLQGTKPFDSLKDRLTNLVYLLLRLTGFKSIAARARAITNDQQAEAFRSINKKNYISLL